MISLISSIALMCLDTNVLHPHHISADVDIEVETLFTAVEL